jgi:hypothetical protein
MSSSKRFKFQPSGDKYVTSEQMYRTEQLSMKRIISPSSGTEPVQSAVDFKLLGNSLVGRMVDVYWPHDNAWYRGMIQKFDSQSGMHLVKYDDGDKEILDLSREKTTLISGTNEMIVSGRLNCSEDGTSMDIVREPDNDVESTKSDSLAGAKQCESKMHMDYAPNKRSHTVAFGKTPTGDRDNRRAIIDVIGSRVSVYWPNERTWYPGRVGRYDARSRLHWIEYDDGDEYRVDVFSKRVVFEVEQDREESKSTSLHDEEVNLQVPEATLQGPEAQVSIRSPFDSEERKNDQSRASKRMKLDAAPEARHDSVQATEARVQVRADLRSRNCPVQGQVSMLSPPLCHDEVGLRSELSTLPSETGDHPSDVIMRVRIQTVMTAAATPAPLISEQVSCKMIPLPPDGFGGETRTPLHPSLTQMVRSGSVRASSGQRQDAVSETSAGKAVQGNERTHLAAYVDGGCSAAAGSDGSRLRRKARARAEAVGRCGGYGMKCEIPDIFRQIGLQTRRAGKEPALVGTQVEGAKLASLGRDAVGRRVEVYWPDDGAWYGGRVSRFDSAVYKHLIR